MRKFNQLTIVAAVLAAIASAAIAAPRAGTLPDLTRPMPKGITAPTPTACLVDPAVTFIHVTRTPDHKKMVIRVEVKNLGPNTWTSDVRQAGVSIKTKNNNTSYEFTRTMDFRPSAAAGERLAYFVSPQLDVAQIFDTFEFGGHIDVSIAYDPDIGADANRCNDDTRQSNNNFHLDSAPVLEFINSPGAMNYKVFVP